MSAPPRKALRPAASRPDIDIPLQRKAAADAGYEGIVALARSYARPRADATGMPAPVRENMEAAFGADSSDVRMRGGSAQAAALGARSYAQGSDMYTAPEHWSPETRQEQAGLSVQRMVHDTVRQPNRTGLPDQLKAGIESLAGISMAGVKVHYNSDKPVQLSALAYTQGSQIHVAPGQERHLPHEAWHVVQQRQGRVPVRGQLEGAGLNDDPALEAEADVMGARAARGERSRQRAAFAWDHSGMDRPVSWRSSRVVQRKGPPATLTQADLASMVTQGWTLAELQTLIAEAIKAGVTNPAFQRMLVDTATSAGTRPAFIGAGWTDADVVQTIFHVLGRLPRTTALQILQQALSHRWQPGGVQSAATAAGGPPIWAEVIKYAPTFAANWRGVNGPGSMGGPVVHTQQILGAMNGGGYKVELELRKGRLEHVENRHSFEHFDMSHQNATKTGPGGFISFYPLGTNVRNHVISILGLPDTMSLADQVAWEPIGDSLTRNVSSSGGGDHIAIKHFKDVGPPSATVYLTQLTQCFPLGSITIAGDDLVAIGRLMGQIP